MHTNQTVFLLLTSFISICSLVSNRFITNRNLRADSAFWYSWLLLIWSSEIVTSFPIFGIYYYYEITEETRLLTLVTFISSALGFFLGSMLYANYRGGSTELLLEGSFLKLTMHTKTWTSLLIFFVGLIEYTTNLNRYIGLRELRIAFIEGEFENSPFYTQFFLFTHAFIILLGYTDGIRGKTGKFHALLSIGGLIVHGLAVGGRINMVVAPLLYFISFYMRAQQRADWNLVISRRARQTMTFSIVSILVGFFVVQLFRSGTQNTIDSIDMNAIVNIIFALPMYISDTFISIDVHASHAWLTNVPLGYFTFDGFYRLFGGMLSIEKPDTNIVFGHIYYRNTADPWAWTQTNMIPRLISDFGSLYWLAIIPISLIAQWLSIYRIRVSYIGNVINSLMIISSAYTILSAPWFTSLNIYILVYAVIIYAIIITIRSISIKYVI